MKIKPLNNYVVLEPAEAEEVTSGGIMIPETAQKKTKQGVVVALSDGKIDDNGKLVESSLKLGDVVIYEKWGGKEVEVDGKDLLIMKENDIIAKIEK